MRKLIAVVLVLVLGIPLMTASLFVASAGARLLSRDFFEAALSGQDLERIVREVSAQDGLTSSTTGANTDIEFDGYVFAGPELLKALFEVVPEGELGAAFNEMLNPALDQLFGGSGRDLDIPTGPAVQVLRPHIPAIAARYAAYIPVASGSIDSNDLRQRPAGISEAQFARALAGAVQASLSGLPDYIPMDSGANFISVAGTAASMLPEPAGLSVTLCLIAAAVLIVIAVTFSSGMGQRISFFGASFVPVGALLILVVALFGQLQVQFAGGMQYAGALGEYAVQYLAQIGSTLANDTLLAGIAALAGGIALVIAGGRITRSSRTAA